MKVPRSLRPLVAIGMVLVAGAAHADAVFTLTPPLFAPDSRGFQNSVQAGTLAPGPGGVAPTHNFLDTWNFQLTNSAALGSLVSTINFLGTGGAVTQGIQNLQLRLIGPTGMLVGWTSVVSTGSSQFQNVISYVDPDGVWDIGSYSIQIRGLLTGSAAAYSGTLIAAPAPVPLPASWPLLMAGMMGLAAFARNRQREER